jgi:transcriptional regulator with GAF, ATPase, and Fis domain
VAQPTGQPGNRDEAAPLGYEHGPPAIAPDVTVLHAAIANLVRATYAQARAHPEEVLERFAVLGSTRIAGVTHASVMLGGKKGIRSSVASGAVPHLIDKIQERTQQGPCLEAMHEHATVRVDDLAKEIRWPEFTEAVLSQTRVRSMLCYRLYNDTQTWGALSLSASTRCAFDADAEESGLILATHAALTYQSVQRARQVRSALGSRDIIGQAKGKLMERYDIGASAAFGLITRLSEESKRPVVVIAKEIVDDTSISGH